MSAINELKPCPFCGGKSQIFGICSLRMTVAVVQCTTCYAAAGFTNVEMFGKELAKEKAVQYWNMRVNQYEQRAE